MNTRYTNPTVTIWLSVIEVQLVIGLIFIIPVHPIQHIHPVFFHPVEAGKPHAVSLWTLGHAVEMATAGGPGRGGVSDWGGG